ncbi:hypothetical protein, partial [Methylobacterium nigriterrae]|uniref:hypothetical protein n=1 Tax=Methylobacterium nigriterrae TaxID=3127512 RepID=UPI0030136D09
DRGDLAAALALDAGRVALEAGPARDRHEVLLPELADDLELLRDEGGLAGIGLDLVVEAGDLLIELGDAIAQLLLLAGARLGAGRKQPP